MVEREQPVLKALWEALWTNCRFQTVRCCSQAEDRLDNEFGVWLIAVMKSTPDDLSQQLEDQQPQTAQPPVRIALGRRTRSRFSSRGCGTFDQRGRRIGWSWKQFPMTMSFYATSRLRRARGIRCSTARTSPVAKGNAKRSLVTMKKLQPRNPCAKLSPSHNGLWSPQAIVNTRLARWRETAAPTASQAESGAEFDLMTSRDVTSRTKVELEIAELTRLEIEVQMSKSHVN